ncbi:nicotinate phosphoribosyltransferase [Lactobacillus selangorensis]|uniref:Nicotinate phosphoribosyltransferase n=2 Tax=Lactobacillus selangorensis TaxID=81857 RepID=A0A0R2GAR6_9LACO|nr:nicotinate phosphoribosyltransferase [Lactobacillus selangorensis]KRN33892.1 nicotinate phosphoribosyltransferase [Lactobacillus selangorensis]
MLSDLYELTMGNGYLQATPDLTGYFDVYFRKVPDDGGLVIFAGLQQVIDYVNDLHFDDEDLAYLKSLGIFKDEFLAYLKDFKFSCDIWSMPEGMPVYANEPLMTVRGPLIQAQLLETMILNTVNHQSLIATKARRITHAAGDKPVMEFGARRAQGPDAANYGARASVIGGAQSTSNVMAGQMFDIPVAGTMAHSWIETFPTEYDAFHTWAELYPHNCALLVDTYDVLHSGVPNAIEVFKELKGQGIEDHIGIRIDSGDITYLTKKARKMLDDAGFPNATITISNALDEWVIKTVLSDGAQVDAFGVGEKLITAKSDAVLSGVYKLVATEKDGQITPKIKISDSVAKTTVPGFKNVYRLYNDDGMAFADLLTLHDEKLPTEQPLHVMNANPEKTHRQATVDNYTAEDIRPQIFKNGKQVYHSPSVLEIQKFSKEQLARQWDEVKRVTNPDVYNVDWSPRLAEVSARLLAERSK